MLLLSNPSENKRLPSCFKDFKSSHCGVWTLFLVSFLTAELCLKPFCNVPANQQPIHNSIGKRYTDWSCPFLANSCLFVFGQSENWLQFDTDGSAGFADIVPVSRNAVPCQENQTRKWHMLTQPQYFIVQNL